MVTPYVIIEIGQDWFKQWLGAWQHQPFTWTTVYESWVRFVAFTLGQFHRKHSRFLSIFDISLKIADLTLQPHLYLYASARCKQLSGESFLLRIDSLLRAMCDTVQLVPFRFDGWVGHGWEVETLDITVGGGRCFWDSEARVRNWAPTCEAMRTLLEFTQLPVHRDMFSCLLHIR